MSVAAEVAAGEALQRAVAERIAQELWPEGRLIALPQFAEVDFLVVSAGDVLLAAVEVKARRVGIEQYPTTILPVRKYVASEDLWRRLKVPTLVAFYYTDGLGSLELPGASPAQTVSIARGGRGTEVAHYEWPVSSLRRHPAAFEALREQVGLLG